MFRNGVTGQEFYRFVNSPEGQGRYFIDMNTVVLETTKAEACQYRAEQDHSNYLKSQEKDWCILSLQTDCNYNGEDTIKDESQDVELNSQDIKKFGCQNQEKFQIESEGQKWKISPCAL